MPLALLALAVGAFGIGTTEFVIAGLLPDVARSFDTSVPTAGLLVSGYALAVAIGAPILTAATTRYSRKPVLVGLMAIFIAGNLLSALAPTYGVLMAGRIVAALSHGAFFGIGSVVAANLVAPHRKASAIAMMFTGLTVANVLGVPGGTLLGQAFGWRSTFWAVTAIGVVALAGIVALVPRQPRPEAGGLRRELTVFADTRVWLSFAVTALGFGGVFAAFTFVAPMMTHLAGFSEHAVTPLLAVFGVGLVIGNIVGGRLADRALMPSLYGILGVLALVLVVFSFTARSQVGATITLFVFGAVGFASVPPLQALAMRYAAASPTLGSAGNIAAFNFGNAVGAWLAGVAITAGLGYTAPALVGAGLAALGLVVAVVIGRAGRSSPAPAGALVTSP